MNFTQKKIFIFFIFLQSSLFETITNADEYEDKPVCSICFESFLSESGGPMNKCKKLFFHTVVKVENCNHTFHRECINEVLKHDRFAKCPYCRGNLKIKPPCMQRPGTIMGFYVASMGFLGFWFHCYLDSYFHKYR